MKLIAAGALALLMVSQFAGCGRQTATMSVKPGMNSSQPTATGLKPSNQVAACCKPMAEGRISLDQCMENPTCAANNRVCCMQAIQ